MREDVISFRMNAYKPHARIALLRYKLLIAKFVDPKPFFRDMEMWLQTLNQELRDSTLTIYRNVGKGFFFFFLKEMPKMHYIMP